MNSMGNDLVREARKRARLTQRELAERAGTTQSAIARLESGRTRPSFEAVLGLLRHCGMDLDVMLVERDDTDWMQARQLLTLTPGSGSSGACASPGRCASSGTRRSTMSPDFEPGPILVALVEHEVQFVMIGGMAAQVHGSPFLTQVVDVTPSTEGDNLARLSAALTTLEARDRTDAVEGGIPFAHDAESLAAAGVWNLTTPHGDLDISMRPSGTDGYADLRRAAREVRAFGVVIPVAALADVIRSKQAANRPKDQRVLPVLREILATRHDRPGV